jgi:hypothetical protein
MALYVSSTTTAVNVGVPGNAFLMDASVVLSDHEFCFRHADLGHDAIVDR